MWSLDEALHRFTELRDDYSDEIPEQVLHSYTPRYEKPPKYKVRGNWFQGVSGAVRRAIACNLISGSDIVDSYMAFDAYVHRDGFANPKITMEDINRGNRLIAMIIEHLERKKKDCGQPN